MHLAVVQISVHSDFIYFYVGHNLSWQGIGEERGTDAQTGRQQDNCYGDHPLKIEQYHVCLVLPIFPSPSGSVILLWRVTRDLLGNKLGKIIIFFSPSTLFGSTLWNFAPTHLRVINTKILYGSWMVFDRRFLYIYIFFSDRCRVDLSRVITKKP